MAIFGDSPTAIRSLSVVFGLLSVGGCGMLGRKLAFTLANDDPQWGQQHWFGLFCAALCGFNAFQVLASVEARMYSLGTLLQVVSTLVTLHVAASPQKKSGWVLLVGVTVASLYTHHFLALTAGIQAIWLLWVLIHERNGGLRNWILAVCCVAVLWIPGLALWLIQLGRVHKDFWIQPMTFWSVPETCFDFFVAPPPGRRWDFRLYAKSSTRPWRAVCPGSFKTSCQNVAIHREAVSEGSRWSAQRHHRFVAKLAIAP